VLVVTDILFSNRVILAHGGPLAVKSRHREHFQGILFYVEDLCKILEIAFRAPAGAL